VTTVGPEPGADVPGDAGPSTAGEPADVDSGEVGQKEILRRLELLAVAYAVLAGAAMAAAGGWRRGVALTVAATVSIVALRSLEGVVRRLRVGAGADRSAGLGWRYPLRLFLSAGLVFLLVLGWHDGLAVMLGLSAVPIALLVEAAVQLFRTRSNPL
jgi:hypothetical protein